MDENEKDIDRIVEKYEHYPSVTAIKQAFPDLSFSFKPVVREDILKEIKNLNSAKATQEHDIPTKILKENANFLHPAFNECVETRKFPSCLKQVDMTPVFKKGSRNSKDDYRPVSILPNVSKIFEKPLFKQMSDFFDNIFSMYQCSAQHCLVAILEKWKSCNDKRKSFGALMTDLSKAFDCLSHELVITKLDTYGFDKQALELTNIFHMLGVHCSSLNEIFSGVLQGPF